MNAATLAAYETAIARLDIAKSNCEWNAPILKAAGNNLEANLARANARAYQRAIDLLTPR